ncbi:flagellar basal body P-ring formation chaperone FlgA [Craterilacuibacter sp.]|uniref:flagellar basal body P-ring formation chaperone FlgA n=1 Tax=Craterilacuibacter sp. TaxID=2870909 RepID=UPI003F31B50B
MAIFTPPRRAALALLLLLSAGSHAAANTPDLQAQLELAADRLIKTRLQSAGPHGYQTALTVIPPREASQLPPCRTLPQIRAADSRTLSRMRFAVSCPGAWQSMWIVRANLTAPPLPGNGDKSADTPSASRPLMPPERMQQPLLIRRGDKVEIIARQPGIEVRVAGEARDNGREGDVIRVQNPASGRTLPMKVIQPGVVTPLAQ